MRRLLALTALALVASVSVSTTALARESVVEVPLTSALAAPTLTAQGFDIVSRTASRARILLPDDAARRRLAAAGYRGRTLVPDTRARTLATLRANARARRSSLPSGRSQYRLLADYGVELQALADQRPGLVRRVDLPRPSVQGRAIQGVEVASGVGSPTDGRPVYVVIGLHHAREWPSGEVAMELARDLADGYGSDPRITRLLDAVRVLVFPVTNPDGFDVSRGSTPLGVGIAENQRKNCAGGCALGVDLNRNHGAFWGGNGASTLSASDTYRGPAPWSEPEAAAIHELSQRLNVTNFTSIHNIAALVLRPPGFEALGLAPDETRLKDLGDRMAAATGYASEYGFELYEVTGATEDWNYVAQNAFGYTIELGPQASDDFHGDYGTHVVDQYLGPDGQRDDGDGVREALLLAGEQAADPRDHSVLDGTAPAGATLRLHRTFKTPTSPLCQFPYNGGSADCALKGQALQLDDGLDTSLVVPDSGRFTWHVTPSTRPFERKAGRTEAWTLTCTAAGSGAVLAENRVVVGIGERRTLTPCVPAAGGGDAVPPPGPPAPEPPKVGARGPALAVSLTRRQRRATVLRRGLLVEVTATRASVLTVTARRSTSRGPVAGRASARLTAGKRRALRVPLNAAARRALRRGTLRRVVLRLDARGGGVQSVETLGVQVVAR